jgi:DNA-binding NarL/FixJ family response regulator
MESDISQTCRIALCASEGPELDRIGQVLCAAGHEVVAADTSAERLIESAADADVELIVLAPASDRFTSGPEIGMLRARLGEIPIVLVTEGRGKRPASKLALEEADGLVHATELERSLPATIQCVLADQLCIPASARDALAQPVFSHREKQVLELALTGLTNGDIASRLFLSESTVKSHLASSFRKLGVTSRSEVAQRLADHGLDAVWQTAGNVAADSAGALR